MIPARAEFVLLSSVLAFALALVAFIAIAGGSDTSQWGRTGYESLKVTPAAFIATLLGTLAVTAWHARARARQRRWSAGGLTLRALLLAFTCFPAVLVLWFGGMVLIESTGGALDSGLVWVLPTVLLFTGIAIVFGAVPAFVIEYFVCRRYLRRTADVTTGSA